MITLLLKFWKEAAIVLLLAGLFTCFRSLVKAGENNRVLRQQLQSATAFSEKISEIQKKQSEVPLKTDINRKSIHRWLDEIAT